MNFIFSIFILVVSLVIFYQVLSPTAQIGLSEIFKELKTKIRNFKKSLIKRGITRGFSFPKKNFKIKM